MSEDWYDDYRYERPPALLASQLPTPMSDALFLRLLHRVDREIAELERAPTRRRRSPKRVIARAQAAAKLTRVLEWLMARYEVIQTRPTREEMERRGNAARRALMRRIDLLCAERDEKEAAEAAKTERTA